MFFEAFKIVARVAAIIAAFGAIVVIFAMIQVPAFDYSSITASVSSGLAVLQHWIPGFMIVWNFIKTLFSVIITLFGIRWIVFGAKWALKVNG